MGFATFNFGLGAAQVLLTGSALAALGVYLAGLSTEAAIIIGFGLALSSTAFAMQVLEDRAETNQKHGQRAFAILLFQDLAIVPILRSFLHCRPTNPRK